MFVPLNDILTILFICINNFIDSHSCHIIKQINHLQFNQVFFSFGSLLLNFINFIGLILIIQEIQCESLLIIKRTINRISTK